MHATPETLAHTYSTKSDEELISLHARGTLTQLAYEILESEMERRGLAVSARPDLAIEREA